MKVKFLSVIFALFCFIIAGCGGDGSNAENGGDGSVKEQGTTLTENDFEFWQDNKDYPIVMKKAKEGIAAVIHSAQKDKDGVFAIDVVGFRTANGESTWEDKWYFKKSGDKLQYSSHQKSFGQKWADVTDSDEAQQKAFQDNMIEFVFKLLFETNDSEATIAWTLGMFGRQYNLDRVSVERYDRITNRYSTDFEWLSPNGISVKQENHQNDISDYSRERTNIMLQLYHPTPYGVMSLCEDTTELDEKYQNTLKFFKLGSFAHVRITHGTRDLGSLCFESARAPRIFSEKELTDLNIFSILLGNILLVRTSDEKVDQENTRLRDILDRMQEFIYVINKNTYEPVFFNQTMRQFLNPISGSLPCYKRFHNLEQPCKGCLVEKLSRNGNEYLHSRLDNWGTPTDTKTYNIIWEENEEKYALVIQDPF